MDLSQLNSLGEVAGIGGIALGVVVLVLRPLIASLSGLPKDARVGPVRLIAIGCFVIGALGIAAWTVGNRAAGPEISIKGAQSPGIVSGGSATVTYGASPATPPPAPSVTSPPPGPPPASTVHTEGNQSPSVVSGGGANVQYPPSSGAK
jgi:hypothetical protein